MNPFKPVTDLTDAITYPFKAIFVVGLCAFINAFTSPGHWWVQWVALGMAIGLLRVWARALKTAITAGMLGGLGYLAYRWWKGRNENAGTTSTSGTTYTQAPTR